MQEKKQKLTIGRKEKIGLPDFGLKNLDAKVDTGAYSSSLHCKILGEKMIDGVLHVRFIPLARKNKARHASEISIPVSKIKNVKSSSGHSEQRYFVKLNIEIGETVYESEFSLSNRAEMKYSVLLGRKVLKGKFLVDVARTYIFYKKLKKRNITVNIQP